LVEAVRGGESQRAVARRLGLSLSRVQYWLRRAGADRLDRVDWSDHRRAGHAAPNRTSPAHEARILTLRRTLRQDSLLGEYGAQAIHAELERRGERGPSLRTIGRILARRGALDGRQRQRRPPPPPGWHLPVVATRQAELDLFDVVEDLKLAGGPLLDVLTGLSLHGGLPAAWPLGRATTTAILPRLIAHWQHHGRPGFVQFDNDTRFQGPHQHRDAIGRVSRLCLQLGITPVFVPPRELGLQNPIEHFNGLFQAKVWRRVRFQSVRALVAHSARYVAALAERRRARISGAPARAPWPADWAFDPAHQPRGQLVYIRRTNERGIVLALGRRWPIDRHWCHRLVRLEVDLARGELRSYALRRSAPTEQPVLRIQPYEPRRP
jgi:transposase-like protein